jgi:uncharacterized hydrophobic protein (TIGR00271 family)
LPSSSETTARVRARSRELTPRLVREALRPLSRPATEEARRAVDELIPTGTDRRGFALRFCALISLSSSIAAFGLLSDSSAVVIGAMLVAPLMTPILATAAATVQAKNRELLVPLGFVAVGTLLAIAVGYAMSLLAADASTSGGALPAEVEARTFPGLLDLGVAVSAGAAAGYILPRRSTTSALPGVGIAVALVPPLVVVGIALEFGATGDAANALLLYLTNLAAIVFAASLMLVLAGFRPHLENSRSTFTIRILVTLGTVVAVAVPLTMHTQSALANRELRGDVAAAVAEWDERARVSELRTSIDDDVAVVSVLVSGPGSPDEVWRLARDIQNRIERPLDLEMRYSQILEFEIGVR